MADRAQPLIRLWPGVGAALLVAALTLGTLAAVALRAEGWAGLTGSDWAAVRFTLLQALLSAAISTALAVPVARALARRRFAGRAALITILGAPFILPVIVAVFGLLAVFGRNGLVSHLFETVGLPPIQIYGLHGVVLAHVFFNLPLATRLILQGWSSIPAERFRLAGSLGFTTGDVARVLERPMLKATVPGAFMVIFLICTTSFAVALALGGGPKATTVELAIYQAFRFEFDLASAALLGLLQFAICAVAAAVAMWVQVPEVGGAGLDRTVERWDARGIALRWLDAGLILSVALFLLVPLGMVALDGVRGLPRLPASVGSAAARSVVVALCAAGLTVVLSLALSFAIAAMRGTLAKRMLEGVGYLAISASPLVVGTGLFILIYPYLDPVSIALPITALVNALMSLPFALRILVPAVAQVDRQFGQLADSLSLLGWARIRHLYLPRLRGPVGFAAGLAAALSMGDLGVVALFADPQAATLPLQMYRLMAAYQTEAAAAAGLLLLALSLALFWLFDRGGRINADG